MQGEHSNQSSLFGMIYEDLIPADHLLRKLSAAVELGFVAELVSDCYCPDNGRPSWDPLVLFKVVFLQFLYDLSDREIEEQVNLHLACKWFAGLQPEETAPDHSTLCRFRPSACSLRHAQGRELVERQSPGSREVSSDFQPDYHAGPRGGIGKRPAADY